MPSRNALQNFLDIVSQSVKTRVYRGWAVVATLTSRRRPAAAAAVQLCHVQRSITADSDNSFKTALKTFLLGCSVFLQTEVQTRAPL